MKILKTSYYKNSFLGLFFKTNNKITLVPKQAPKKTVEVVTETLATRPVEILVNQSPLLGLMSCMNDYGCILARLAEQEEAKKLKKEGLTVYVMKESFAPGNTLLANNKALVASSLLSKKEAEKIAECLDVECLQASIGSIKTIGALNVVTNKGLFAYNDITEVELKKLEKIFGVHGGIGTTNTGALCNALGVVANDCGAVTGELTTGFEMQRIYQALAGE